MEPQNDIRADTRFFEGLYNGTKFAIVHALLISPYSAKEKSLYSGRTFRYEYLAHCSKAFLFYSGIMSTTFGLRHLVCNNKSSITRALQDNVPPLKD